MRPSTTIFGAQRLLRFDGLDYFGFRSPCSESAATPGLLIHPLFFSYSLSWQFPFAASCSRIPLQCVEATFVIWQTHVVFGNGKENRRVCAVGCIRIW